VKKSIHIQETFFHWACRDFGRELRNVRAELRVCAAWNSGRASITINYTWW
jgi:hypothetical protein